MGLSKPPGDRAPGCAFRSRRCLRCRRGSSGDMLPTGDLDLTAVDDDDPVIAAWPVGSVRLVLTFRPPGAPFGHRIDETAVERSIGRAPDDDSLPIRSLDANRFSTSMSRCTLQHGGIERVWQTLRTRSPWLRGAGVAAGHLDAQDAPALVMNAQPINYAYCITHYHEYSSSRCRIQSRYLLHSILNITGTCHLFN